MVIKNLLGKKDEQPANDEEVKKLREKFNNIVNSDAPEQAVQQPANPAQPAQEFQYVDPQKAEDNERITNLIMQQIKELIEIDNNLNAKNKELENKISENASTLSSTKSLVEQFNSRLELIEKNMEKFMGLYEVVTNRFNPFVSEEDDDGAVSKPDMMDLHKPPVEKPQEAKKEPDMMDMQDTAYGLPDVDKEVTEIIEHTKLDKIEPEQQTIIKDELKETVKEVGPAEIDKIKDDVAKQVTETVEKELKDAVEHHMKLSNEKLQNAMKEMLLETVKHIKEAHTTEQPAKPEVQHTEELHPDFHFNLPDGTPIKRISDLREALKTMDDAHFKEHVDDSHNDFADWLHVVLKDDAMADRIRAEKTKEGIAKILEEVK